MTVVANIEIVSRANALRRRNRCNCLNRLVLGESCRLGAISSRVSAKVTKTAPATRAAGAPKLEHHANASDAISRSTDPPRMNNTSLFLMSLLSMLMLLVLMILDDEVFDFKGEGM